MSAARRPRGFTIVEVSIVSAMMALLVTVVSVSWQSIGKAAVDVIARSELVQEMDLTVASLTRDLGGFIINSVGQLDANKQMDKTNFLTPTVTGSGTILTLTQDDTLSYVRYELDSGNTDLWKRHNLVRTYYDAAANSTTTFTVARNVDSFLASWDAGTMKLTLTIQFSCNYRWRVAEDTPTGDRDHSVVKRRCILVACKPL